MLKFLLVGICLVLDGFAESCGPRFMSHPLGPQLYYRTSFDLVPTEGGVEDLWPVVVTRIGDTIRERFPSFINQIRFGKFEVNSFDLFGTGSVRLDSGTDWLKVATRAHPSRPKVKAPQFWAVRIRHPDSPQSNHFEWQTDIGLTLSEKSIRVNITVHYESGMPDWLINEPTRPLVQVPRVVLSLLSDTGDRWRAFSGEIPVTGKAMELRSGDGSKLKGMFEDPNRSLPILFVSNAGPRAPSDGFYANPHELAQALAGVAIVFFAADDGVREIMQTLPINLRCDGGAIRFYRPLLSLDDDARFSSDHHPFLIPDPIRRMQQAGTFLPSLYAYAVQNIFTFGRMYEVVVLNISDVIQQETDSNLQRAYELLGRNMVSWLTGEDVSDTGVLEQYVELLESDVRRARDRIAQLELEQEARASGEPLAEVAFPDMGRLAQLLGKTKAALAQTEQRLLRIRQAIQKFPNSMEEVIPFAEALFADRLVFTDSAHTSAKKTQFKDVLMAMRVLQEMANQLYDLYFFSQVDTNQVPAEFHRVSGFRATGRESGATREVPGLAALRTFPYNGRPVDASAHVKAKSEGKQLRVHYFVDRENRRIVIAHVGDHLPTAGER